MRLFRAALAGAFIGAWWGIVETLVRVLVYRFGDVEGYFTVPEFGLLDAAGAVALSGFEHGIIGAVLGAVAALVLQPVLGALFPRRSGDWSAFVAPRFAALAAALFLEAYWWTRYAFDFAYGERFHSPRRLALGAALLVLSLAVAWMFAAWLARHRRAGLRFQAACLVLVAAASLGFLLRERFIAEGRPALADARGRYNVVLVIVDTLRADHLKTYGYPRDTSPRLDALAREGILFERCVAQAPYTWTSFGSIFTGLYPRRHGLVKMDPTQRFDPRRNVTLQRILDDAGYRTGAFMTGAISSATGLIHGFQEYFEETKGRRVVHRGSIWSYFRSELVVEMLAVKLRKALKPSLVTDEARRWMDDNRDSRFLSVIHLYSTHTPYDPPREHDVFSPPERARLLDQFTTYHASAFERGEATCPPELRERIIDLYDGGVRFADALIGDVIDQLERDGILDETVVVVTADHGEELGERGLWEHDWMFNTNQLVPLIVRLPGRQGAGTRVACPVESIDILPTVLEACGLPARADLDGMSLMPWARGERPREDDVAFCENNFYVSVQDREWKLVRNRLRDPRDPARLYHLAADPLEFRNVAAAHPEKKAELEQVLDAFEARMPEVKLLTFDADAASSQELARQLRENGYLGDRPIEGLHVQEAEHAAAGGDADPPK